MRKLSMVVPSIPQDVEVLLDNLDIFFNFLPITSLIIIGPEKLKLLLPNDNRIKFINEDDLVDKSAVKAIIEKRLIGRNVKRDRSGWYIQQFIKMLFSRICSDDYYLLWDSDTIPVKEIQIFDENDRPYFDIKTEYNKPYFDTISTLFPGITKHIEGSFIAEHMLINTKYMQSLLQAVEENRNIEGSNFIEKIINSISAENLLLSGFSEFETYGTYVQITYPDSYALKNWKSLRFGGYFFSHDNMGGACIKWLAKQYDAISFEKIHRKSKLSIIVNSSCFQKLFNARILILLSIPLRLKDRFSDYFG